MQIIYEEKLDFCDVLIKPKRSKTASRSKVDLSRNYQFLNSKAFWTGVPIIAANMSTTGTVAMAKAMSRYHMMTCLHKFYDVDTLVNFFREQDELSVFYTMGISEDDREKLDKVVPILQGDTFHPGVLELICLDVANGYTEFFHNKVKEIRNRFPHAVIMAGNVCTPEMVQELLISGAADIVKIGIGPGSVCTTRIATGVGYPQLSAIIECADAAHGCGGHICADGGCTTPGDVVKAFAAGADFVMLGGMLAGTDECGGSWEYDEDCRKVSLEFYGMSSQEAMDTYCGGMKDYRASEGKCVSVPYKGPVADVLQQITGGLRSACAYVGTDKLKDLSKCTTFVRVGRTHNTIYGG